MRLSENDGDTNCVRWVCYVIITCGMMLWMNYQCVCNKSVVSVVEIEGVKL
jgi:hypothetical protein